MAGDGWVEEHREDRTLGKTALLFEIEKFYSVPLFLRKIALFVALSLFSFFSFFVVVADLQVD